MIWVWGVLLTLLTLVLAIVARRLHSTRERFSQVESRLAGVLEMSDAGLAVWNQQGRLIACNKRFWKHVFLYHRYTYTLFLAVWCSF